MTVICPDCKLDVTFAYWECSMTGKTHKGKPNVVQYAPIDGPVYTISDPDLNRLLNETHWESVGASQGIGGQEGAIAWMEALEAVEARLSVADNMRALYKHVERMMQSDCDEATWKVQG